MCLLHLREVAVLLTDLTFVTFLASGLDFSAFYPGHWFVSASSSIIN